MPQQVPTLTVLGIAMILPACSALREQTMPEDANLLSGAGSLMTEASRSEHFEKLDLSLLLVQYNLDKVSSMSGKELDEQSSTLKYRRNELQDRIIAASNQRCGTYLRILISTKSQTQMGWGGLATLLSGAASVVSHLPTSQALAAGSTVSNGFLSLYNEAYFNNLAVNVISSGIDKRREAILKQITALRDETLVQYPVNRAIADALLYHSACNIISGLETAAAATKSSSPNNTDPKGLAPTLK